MNGPTDPIQHPITERQFDVLLTIHRLSEQFGHPPSVREIGDALGISSTNGVFGHLFALQRKGLISQSPTSKARTTRLTEPAKRIISTYKHT